MSINIIDQQEKLLLACVTLNFVEDLEEFKEFRELSAEEKGYKAILEYVADMIDNEVSDKTLEKVYQGHPSTKKTIITDKTYHAIFDNELFNELGEKIYEGIQNNDKVIMDKVTDIIEHRIENKEFPKLLDRMKKSDNRHFALPVLFQNDKLLTDVLDHLPLVEKIFESEKNLSIFIKLTNRLEGFEYMEKRDEWDLLDELLVSSQKNHGFDDYL